MVERSIRILGARQNNLKNLDIAIPLGRITVITGVSGSGKSSLAFDTLYAEGQRRYMETFSPYARQFMDRMDRPAVDRIDGIPPAIAIDRKDPVRTSRSTVGTMTEITDFVKLLFARLSTLFCKGCGKPVTLETPGQVGAFILSQPEGSRVMVAFPVVIQGDEDPGDAKAGWIRMGFDRQVINGEVHPLEAGGRGNGRTIHIVADRLALRKKDRKRILDSVEQAFRFGNGKMAVWIEVKPHGERVHRGFSTRLECPDCRIDYAPPLPNLFSFNSPIGACEFCRGFGRTIDLDLDLVIPNPGLTLDQGAVKPWGTREGNRMEFRDMSVFCRENRIPLDVPFSSLDQEQKQKLIDGTPSYYGIRGFFRWLETRTYKMPVRVFLSRYRSYNLCSGCSGARFKDESLRYRLGGFTIAQVYALNVHSALEFFRNLFKPGAEEAGAGGETGAGDEAGRMVLGEVISRLEYLKDVGLGYLTLDRQSRTLSGGEVQRVALASSLGASLVNTLYVLDEPSIGLHPRDNHRLIGILKRLRDHSNTVVVVEHDPDIIRCGDFLLDLGPGAGEQGGNIMYFGPTAAVDGSLTGQYLRGERRIPTPPRKGVEKPDHWIVVRKAEENNLKRIDVRIPLNRFICLTGVSGSGKSTLAEAILYRAVKREKQETVEKPGKHDSCVGLDQISDAVLVDQQAIGQTPRANALTYTGAMGPIRSLLAGAPGAREKGLTAASFSFNVAGGRCDACLGQGYEKVEMQFLSDVFITCPECGGRRFKQPVLDVYYRGKNILDILNLTIDDALVFFQDQEKISAALEPLVGVGLGYLRLGQPVNTLSGGEAQRLKLSRRLKPGGSTRRLFIFDEPTTGLHFDDIEKLLAALHRLVQQGNTVLVIEHNLDVIKTADWVIDLGPEGGDEGGFIVVEGPPDRVAAHETSHTGRFLRGCLEGGAANLQGLSGPPAVIRESEGAFDRLGAHHIEIRGAREHNLKDLNLTLPRNRLIALTGVSGSGKSTLAFDLLFAEGQRRYLESLAPYVRQYLKIMERPDVDLISGLPPAVAIEQRISHAGRRSTVATLTEIYHFFRLLFSKAGTQHCTGCGKPLNAQSRESILDGIARRYRGKSALVLAPKIAGRKGFHRDVLERAVQKGFTQARIDGRIVSLPVETGLSRRHEHFIDLVVGRLTASRLPRLVDLALEEGGGSLIVADAEGREEIFSQHGTCLECGIGMETLDPRQFSFNSRLGACSACDGLGSLETPSGSGLHPCPECGGSRLNPRALSVKIGSLSIWDLSRKSAAEAFDAIRGLSIEKARAPIAEPIVAELLVRLALLNRLGLSYLSLSRSGDTLSGGEAQRVRLAAQLGSNLTGVMYILDEPTIGLHPRDSGMLLDALRELKERGNTVLVVEHDEETIRAADTIVDLGPGAGRSGGSIVASGSLHTVIHTPASRTGAGLAATNRSISSRLRPYADMPAISVRGASKNNLKSIDVDLPLNTLTVFTGVSGSGKSSLLKETIFKGISARLSKQRDPDARVHRIDGWENLARILEVDHSPIGRTPRSAPASYVGFWDDIRKLFASSPEARTRGYGPGRFSFNMAGGRCDICKGQGQPKVSMPFLPDVYVPCEACGGKRYNRQTLEVAYRGKTISDVLNLTFAEAADFFAALPQIRRALGVVCEVGLGYLQLGQPSPTLSGGEAQRIKLAKQLARSSNGHTLYTLDEPTTGLHGSDIDNLIRVLQALVDRGNTVAVIEHNLEVIKAADYIIDLGPEGGDSGGRVVVLGSPVEILNHATASHTARYLKKYLNP